MDQAIDLVAGFLAEAPYGLKQFFRGDVGPEVQRRIQRLGWRLVRVFMVPSLNARRR
jgi:hypothetical protein